MAAPQALHDMGIAEKEDTIFLLQEVPRRQAGWHTDVHQGWSLLSFRQEDTWRGTGLLYRGDRWKIVRRVASDRGTWYRIRHVIFANEVWVGSAHFDPACTQASHRAAVEQHLSKLKPTSLPVILASDINSPIRWEVTDQGDVRPMGRDGKTVGFLECVASRGLRLAAPSESQFDTPTSRPRQEGRHGRQIDCISYKGLVVPGLRIHVDTHKGLGTDHEMLQVTVQMRGERHRKVHCTRPRVWTGGLEIVEGIDQETLKNLAKHHTKPKPGQGYRDPEEVKRAACRARRSGLGSDWKEVQNMRKAARKKWEGQRIKDATQGNWDQVRNSGMWDGTSTLLSTSRKDKLTRPSMIT